MHASERRNRGVTMETYSKQLKEIFEGKFDLDFDLPVVFLDTHYNRSNPEELAAFSRESQKLWEVSLNRRPFPCLTRKDVQVSGIARKELRNFMSGLYSLISSAILRNIVLVVRVRKHAR